jgi:mRNA-degrading endonuclease RelE of RelBE toxin-antitoxin system
MNVVVSPAAAAEIDELPKAIRARVLKIARRLENWPDVSGVKALSGNLVGKYRIRTGDYRVQFRIQGEIVCIERVGHRDGFYEE